MLEKLPHLLSRVVTLVIKMAGSDGTDGTTLVNFKVEDNAALKTFSSSITSCNEYRSPSGKYTWTTPGNYSDTLLNAAGCDSVIDFSLTVVSIDTSIQKERRCVAL